MTASTIPVTIALRFCVTVGFLPRRCSITALTGSLYDGGHFERVVRQRRGQVRPLERVGALPLLLLGRLSAADRREHVPEEEELREAEEERADARDGVPLMELQRVIRDAARHARETEEVLREESDVEADHREPEVDL